MTIIQQNFFFRIKTGFEIKIKLLHLIVEHKANFMNWLQKKNYEECCQVHCYKKQNREQKGWQLMNRDKN